MVRQYSLFIRPVMLFLIKSLVVRSGVPILTKMTMMHLENGNLATPEFEKGMVSENMDINAAFGAMGCFGFTQQGKNEGMPFLDQANEPNYFMVELGKFSPMHYYHLYFQSNA